VTHGLKKTQLPASLMDTPLLEIVSNLMIEEWSNITSYDNYFNECKPSLCTATYISRGDVVHSIITIIGLFGGLTKIYRFLVALIVTPILRIIIRNIRRQIRNNIVVSAITMTVVWLTH
jgi:hypothetical protein